MLRVILCLCLFISGCSILSLKKVDEDNTPKLKLPEPIELNMRSIKFLVVTKDNVDKVFKLLENNEEDLVIFSLTGTDYKNLSLNIQEIKNYIKQQRSVIKLYKEYYEETK